MQDLRMENDERLVLLYENGNDCAFDVLLQRHKQFVYAYILTIVCDTVEADDIFQETWLRAINTIRAHRYSEKGRFANWLLTIARNYMCDLRRRVKPMVEMPDVRTAQRLFDRPDMAAGNVEDLYHNTETFAQLGEMIGRLPQAQQEVLRMRIYEEKSFKEIAALTHCSINTALGRMHYAVKALKRMAQGEDMFVRVC